VCSSGFAILVFLKLQVVLNIKYFINKAASVAMAPSVFTDFLQQHGLSQQNISELCKQTEYIQAPAKAVLVRQGTQADKFYFLLNGLCHATYLTADGKQFSKEFFWKKSFIVGFEALLTQQASPYTLETVKPSLLCALPVHLVEKWRAEKVSIYINLLEIQLHNKEIKERVLLLNTPEERYKLFCENFSELEVILADFQIASYLGISPISLSRIKKRIRN